MRSPAQHDAARRLLDLLTERQVKIAEAYIDGFPLHEIAERVSMLWIDRPALTLSDVRRELYQIERKCRLVGARLPRQEEIAPDRLLAHDECQLSDRVYRAL